MRRTWLYGVGAHGKDIQAIWHRVHPHRRLWLCDDSRQVQNHQLGIYPSTMIRCQDEVILGAYFHRELQWRRAGNAHEAKTLIHPEAMVGGDGSVRYAYGVVIARGAVVDQDVVLGRHVHINYGASMTRCTIGDFSTVSPGAVIAGDVTIGQRVFIGAGAIITNLLSIGDDAVIGAGAVVLHDVPAGARVFGNPAAIR